ncbi:16S rRNA (cytidine(1402)-2'-O)-methyltransferase [Kaistia dalseonensis]|uniref:Ribosomal RNA small subunit methyltransferase I n=1 Tax=Kaistia dalseonensis TaxID=410840 RepID=A0ABU0H570_9HYPH|nr:16S rRNA (cytidine(1402)-2'-O)-methyltransferase [Kaistia dalseonensis]MCX5494869.1 16S rRNA (cytidine(1402)-2'-O)-methyltransferase [Kaistia dalseonensis]MDQ0437450.1 16S rRNA (cytidine1402-2'-O)-methyltransferase [Kaistia dalseonensis]
MSPTDAPTIEAMGRSYAIEGNAFRAPLIESALYIVATPIGNLRDITLRALATLAAADLIACEDTRVTRVLTRHFAIDTPLLAYHEHNAEQQRPKLIAALDAGKVVALVSDAGTPLVSDPGFRLVGSVLEAGHTVVPIPGASALLASLVTSALPTDSFLFAGFLPTRTVGRKKRLAELANVPATLVFYESPHRTAEALADMAETLGPDRPAVVARELTKTFETVRRGRLATLAAEFAAEPTPKGEIVILLGPPLAVTPDADDVDSLLERLLADHPVREAAQIAATETGLARRDLYQRALALKSAAADDDEDDADGES